MDGGDEDILGWTRELEERCRITLSSDDRENHLSLEEARREKPVVLLFYPVIGIASARTRWASCKRRWGASRRRARGSLLAWIPLVAQGLYRGAGHRVSAALGIRAQGSRGPQRQARGRLPERSYFIIDKDGAAGARKSRGLSGEQPEVDDVLEDLDKAL